jgi:hypothetical protein
MLQNKLLFKLSTLCLVLLAGLLAADSAQAQGAPYLELLRSDVNAEKVAIMTEGMMLTAEQGDIFWPMYREFQGELSKLGDRRVTMIRKFVGSFETLTDEQAVEISKEWFSLHEARLKLLKKTHAKVAKELGQGVAARFVQIESTLQSMIDVQIAAEMPIFPDTAPGGK